MRYVVAPVRSRSLSPAPILDVLVQLHRRARQGRQPEIPFDGVVGEGSESCYLGSRRYTNGSAARVGDITQTICERSTYASQAAFCVYKKLFTETGATCSAFPHWSRR